MAAALKHLKSHKTPSSTHMGSGLSVAPAVQAIVVNRVSVVDPQLASIIRDKAEMVMSCPENSQAPCPAHSKLIVAAKTRPSTTCVTIVHNVLPASMCSSAPIEVLAASSLTKVINVLPEKPSTISGGSATHGAFATGTYHNPSVAGIGPMVPEEHPGMTTTLKHLKPHKAPTSTNMLPGLSVAPAVQAIVVNRVPIVDPQLAAIIRNEAEVVMACLEDPQAACPTYCEMVASSKTRPFATCVAIVHIMFPTGHVWVTTIQVLAPATLTKIEDILSEEAMTVSDGKARPSAPCLHNSPSVASVGTSVPEKYPSMPTTLEHLKPHKTPPATKMLVGFPIAPSMQTIVIDCVPMINP
jgi:hypothetical protein